MAGLAEIVEEAIKYPGFSFVNVQSPCVSFGDPESQIKVQKTKLQRLSDLGHDPSDRLRAIELAQHYGRALHTGIFYRNPSPPPSYERQIAELKRRVAGPAAAGASS